MESLSPSLKLLLCMKLSLERGESLRQGLQYYFSGASDELTVLVAQWLALRDQGASTLKIKKSISSQYRRVLLDVIDRGLKGESILPILSTLETEIIQACTEELERRTTLLPMKALIPLLLLQFPALAILFLSPLFGQLMHFI